MLYSTFNISTDHPMYRHMIPLLDDNSRVVPDTAIQVIVLQGIKPIAHFFGPYAKLNAKELIKILEAKSLFSKVA